MEEIVELDEQLKFEENMYDMNNESQQCDETEKYHLFTWMKKCF